MNTKHTAGPWKIDNARDPGGLTVRATTDRGFYPVAKAELSGHIGIEQAKANTQLIAAAPELLEACKAVVDAWEKGDLGAAARLCNSAYNKATTQTP